jgi:hypothetical protein
MFLKNASKLAEKEVTSHEQRVKEKSVTQGREENQGRGDSACRPVAETIFSFVTFVALW